MDINFDWDNGRKQGLIVCDEANFSLIREHFSVENKAAKFSQNPWAPKRRYIITPGGRFDIGLFTTIITYIYKTFPGVKAAFTESFKKQYKRVYNISECSKLQLSLRDYQDEVVKTCFKQGRGTVVLGTGGGKTLIIATLLESIFKTNPSFKCLLTVPDLGLVNQTYNDFKSYGVSYTFSKWTGKDELQLGKNVIIANLGILQSECSNIDWIEDVDLLVVDEVHKCRKDNSINKIIKLVRTPNKFGFTGTLPDTLIDQWNIIGKFGDVIYEKNSAELRDEKYLTQVQVVLLVLDYKYIPVNFGEITSPTQKYRQELDFLKDHTFRNKIISQLCQKLDNNTLILVNHIDHGEILYSLLKKNCPDKSIHFVRGEVEVEERQAVITEMEKQKNVICIAISKIFSTGINVKNLHYIVFAAGGKAKITTVQAIGRGLRLHPEKEKLIIFDIADQLPYATNHMEQRRVIYTKEKIKYSISKFTEK